MFYYYRIPTTEVHKVDGLHEGSIFMSTKWTDPTRVNCLTKTTKWTNPTRVNCLTKSTKWTDPTRVNCLTKSTKWTDPTRNQYSAHKVDEPHKG